MHRYGSVVVVALLCLVVVPPWNAPHAEPVADSGGERIARLFATAPVVDGNLSLLLHDDSVDENGRVGVLNRLLSERIDLVLDSMGVDVIAMTLSSDPEKLDTWVELIASQPRAVVAQTWDDIERALAEEQLAILFYSQKHYPLDGDARRIREYAGRSLRIFQVVYGGSDLPNVQPEERLAAGGLDEHPVYRSRHGVPYSDFGLTMLGNDVVRELESAGVLIDVSHAHADSIRDVLAQTRGPILANHVNARALTPSLRNIDDATALAIAQRGGVIGVMAVGIYLDTDGDRGDLSDLVRHVDYLVDLVGIDHVGLASDSYINGWPAESRFHAGARLNALNRWQQTAEALATIRNPDQSLKYSDDDLRKLLGGNFLRVYRAVLSRSRESSAAPTFRDASRPERRPTP